jgi:hypothetical protein
MYVSVYSNNSDSSKRIDDCIQCDMTDVLLIANVNGDEDVQTNDLRPTPNGSKARILSRAKRFVSDRRGFAGVDGRVVRG